MKPAVKWLAWGCLVAVVALCVWACSSGKSSERPEPVKAPITTPSEGEGAVKEEAKEDLSVSDVKISRGDFGIRSITGIVTNNTNHEYTYVQVEFNLYDSDGAQVGSTLANVNNLEPQGRWKFEAMILEDRATEYKLKDITAF